MTNTHYVPCGGICPYDQSVKWQIHNNYFQKKGGAAWKGDVPYHITCNESAARQNAEVTHAAIRLMEEEGRVSPDEPLYVLEIASGLGLFAINFIAAMRELDSEAGTSYAARLRYLFTDYSEKNLQDASQNPALRMLAGEGVLSFCVLDALRPEVCRPLGEEESLPTPPCVAVIANYLHCVLPLHILSKKDGQWREKHVQTLFPVPEHAANPDAYIAAIVENPTDEQIIQSLQEEVIWREVEEQFFRSVLHREAIEQIARPYEEATVIYPYGSMQNIEQTLSFLKDGGVILISDKGYHDAARMQGNSACAPSLHGNCFAHSFNFPLVEEFARMLGLSAVRTADPDYSIQTLLIEKRPSHRLEDAFRSCFIEHNRNVEANDLYHAAELFQEKKDFPAAIRLFRQSLALRPHDARTLQALGRCHLESEQSDDAFPIFAQGEACDYFNVYDFAFDRGRALYRLARYAEALEAFERSRDACEHEASWLNIGLCRRMLGDPESARKAFYRALSIRPDYARAKEELGVSS